MKIELYENGFTPDGKWQLVPVEPSPELRLEGNVIRRRRK